MKAIISAKKLSKKKSDEKKNLLPVKNDGVPKYSGEEARSRNPSESSVPSPRVLRRTTSNTTDGSDISMANLRRSNTSPPSSPKPPLTMNLDFSQVPFQFYTSINTSWAISILQALLVCLSCLLLPSFVVLVIMLINKRRLKYKGRMPKADKERQGNYLLILFLITLLKDSMLLAIVLDSIFITPVSKYQLAYASIVFLWTLFCFIFPLAIFLIGDTRYIFGFDSDKKKLLELFTQITSLKVKESEIKKISDQEKYFSEKYKLLSNVKTSSNELKFLKESTSKTLIVVSVVITIIACIIHAMIPMLLQIFECSFCKPAPVIVHVNHTSYNATINKNITVVSNKTITSEHHYGVYVAVFALSTLNSFFVSLFASMYFVFVTLWKISLLKEWKRFNANETMSSTTLVNSGPQGIAMWWKIRQTLKLYSTSSLSMSVVISKIQCVINFLCIVLSSISLILFTRNTRVQIHALAPLIADTIYQYFALFIIGCVSILIDKEQSLSTHLIQLKQINVYYELGSYMNMEQEAMDREVRAKVRLMRGSSVLLQELTSAMDKLEKNTSSRLNIICFLLASLLAIPSLFLTFRYISVN